MLSEQCSPEGSGEHPHKTTGGITMKFEAGSFDVAVIGAGHAGIEAGLACARLGLHTAV